MKNSKINPVLLATRFLGYALLLAGFFWLFIAIPMFSHVISRRVIEQSDARLAQRTQNTFTLRDMETEAHASIQDAFALYPGHAIPTLLMVTGGIILAYAPRSNWRLALSEETNTPAAQEEARRDPDFFSTSKPTFERRRRSNAQSGAGATKEPLPWVRARQPQTRQG